MRGALQFQFVIPERLKDLEFVILPGPFYNWDLWASLQTRVSVSSSMKWGWFPLLRRPLSEAWGGGSGRDAMCECLREQCGSPHGAGMRGGGSTQPPGALQSVARVASASEGWVFWALWGIF